MTFVRLHACCCARPAAISILHAVQDPLESKAAAMMVLALWLFCAMGRLTPRSMILNKQEHVRNLMNLPLHIRRCSQSEVRLRLNT